MADDNVTEPQEINQEAISALVDTLGKVGVMDADDPVKALEGKLAASQQAGNLANQLGDTRNELAGVTKQLKEMQTRQPVAENFNLDEYSQQTLTKEQVREESKSAVREVFQEENRKQQQLQQQMLGLYNNISADSDYPIVKEIWEAKLQDPNFSNKLSSGQLHPERAYMETKIEALKGIAKQSLQTINTLQGTVPKPNTPALETSDRGQPQNLVGGAGSGGPTPEDKQIQTLHTAIEKGYRPSDDEMLDTFDGMIDEVFAKKSE